MYLIEEVIYAECNSADEFLYSKGKNISVELWITTMDKNDFTDTQPTVLLSNQLVFPVVCHFRSTFFMLQLANIHNQCSVKF